MNEQFTTNLETNKKAKNFQARKDVKENVFQTANFPGFKTLLKTGTKVQIDGKTSKKLNFDFYTFMEKAIVEENWIQNCPKNIFTQQETQHVEKTLNSLRQLSIELQRNNPTEWNDFLNVCVQSK